LFEYGERDPIRVFCVAPEGLPLGECMFQSRDGNLG